MQEKNHPTYHRSRTKQITFITQFLKSSPTGSPVSRLSPEHRENRKLMQKMGIGGGAHGSDLDPNASLTPRSTIYHRRPRDPTLQGGGTNSGTYSGPSLVSGSQSGAGSSLRSRSKATTVAHGAAHYGQMTAATSVYGNSRRPSVDARSNAGGYGGNYGAMSARSRTFANEVIPDLGNIGVGGVGGLSTGMRSAARSRRGSKGNITDVKDLSQANLMMVAGGGGETGTIIILRCSFVI